MIYPIETTGRAMKRNAAHPQRKLFRPLTPRIQWWVAPAAFLAVLMALPVNAAVTVAIPGDPLASGVRVAPNILFILDDSGSMARTYMPDNVPSTSTFDVSDFAYTRNSLSYNPAVNYQPWKDADGNRVNGGTGGISYTDAYSATQAIPYTGVKDDDSTGVITTSGTTDLSQSTQTFYLPVDKTQTGSTYLGNGANYYRFQILNSDGKIYRAEWSNQLPAFDTYDAPFNGTKLQAQVTQECTKNCNKANPTYKYTGAWANVDGSLGTNDNSTAPSGSYFTLELPAGTTNLTVETSGSDADADIYFKKGSAPKTNSYNCLANGSSSNETCSFDNPGAGTWYIAVRAANTKNADFSNVSISATYTVNPDFAMGCATSTSGYDWRKCVRITPAGAVADAVAEAKEKINYSTWYSYFRTRNKAAKAGAAEAFNAPALGKKVRVGFTTIWDSNPFYIPVGDGNDGRFDDNDGTNGNSATKSRSKWFSHLFAAGGSSTTPLQKALNRAGQYYSDAYTGKTGVNGPYGPESTKVLSCRQNFSILTTDGYWNDSTINVGDDGDNAAGITVTNGLATTDENYKSFAYAPAAPYSLDKNSTLADIAMKYWKKDLMPLLTNNVPSSYPNNTKNDDPAFWQHMVTFGISIGLSGTTGWKSVADVPNNATWPDPTDAEDGDRIDDLLHAAVNGRGTFVAATNPQEFANGLAAALSKINERTASFSNAGASDSTSLNSGTAIFTASYVAGLWSGLLRAEGAVSGSELWNTKTTADVFPSSYSSRNILTRDGSVGTDGVGAGGTGGGATFPTANQLTKLTRTGGPAKYAVDASDNADYIKGNQTKEGSGPGELRVRSSVLGDIVNSSPAYEPDTNTVYIGANDGMLHAFDGTSGAEKFAYIPNIINFGNLADLSRGDYGHLWFVDGPIVISPKTLGPDGDTNILVGTLGRGGKGLYALDVTDPSDFSVDDVKWERSSTGTTTATDNMGMVLGSPVLGKVRTAAATLTSAVMLGNGINSGSDKAALLVLNLETGEVIKEIATDSTLGNGLFAPTGVYAADGKTLVYAYAGDLKGNVWKFDMTSTDPDSWSAKNIFSAVKDGTAQPISAGIAVAVDPRTNKRWVFFGTGSYLTAADGNDAGTNKQSMYGVIDDIGTGSAYTRDNLTARTVTDGTGTDDDERYFADLKNLTNSGWYVDLPAKGERIVQNAQIDGSFLVTASMMPSGDSCDDALGSGYINAITPFPDMLASTTSYFDRDGAGGTDDVGTNGKPTGSIRTAGMPTLPLLLPGQLRVNTSSGLSTKLLKGQPLWNRVSWRELRND